MRIDKFVMKKAPRLPRALMYKHFRLGRIKCNGKKKVDIGFLISGGDLLELYINDEFFEATQKSYDFLLASDLLSVVYEDENIIIVDKPAGVLCHPDKNNYVDTLISRILRYLYTKGEYNPSGDFCPALANRIDRGTGGLVLAAKNSLSLRELCKKIKLREIDKRYLAAVKGTLVEKSGTLKGYILKDTEKNRVTIKHVPFGDAQEVCSNYRVISENNDISLLEVQLVTGKTHQIRAQFANIGHALMGDLKYGNDSRKGTISRQALYSYRVTFCFNDDGPLNYLNGKCFEASSVPFADELFGICSTDIK